MAVQIQKPKRSDFIAFYVTEEEKQFIVDCACRWDMTVSDYCRRVLTGRIGIPYRKDERKVVEHDV